MIIRKVLQKGFSTLYNLKQFRHQEIPQNVSVDREFGDTVLQNGIRVCTEFWPSELAHITIYIKCGSRNETEATSGTAHFLEHLHFKGTGKRSRDRLECDVENFGGQLNAYTSRENTSYTINAQKNKAENAVEILGDMLTNSIYAKSDVERERHTIYRELYETRKMQFETLIEISHRSAYKNHQMSLPILGKIQNMYSITREMIADYHKNNYYGENLIICGVGNIKQEQLCEYVTKHFSKIHKKNQQNKQEIPVNFQNEVFLMQSELTEDINVGLFYKGPEWTDPHYYHFLILQRLLGDKPSNFLEAAIFEQSTLNSFQKLLLDYPEITTQKAVYTPYKDTALFGNYFVVNPNQLDSCIEVSKKIFEDYANQISSEELQRSKRRLFIELCQHETGNDISQAIANQILYFDRRVYRQEIAQNLANVTEEDIQNCVKSWILGKQPSLTIWGNIDPVLKKYKFDASQVGTH
ncbi:unnamed protein product [Paramecium sonneborni]|uniref:Uncharacterized protein n=1 Tax=Paramecium sonneborni TaxID=65129 RepID=A0A8S1L4R7_9CILI|nr:unnamed protein product [Paramecium sonneborni]